MGPRDEQLLADIGRLPYNVAVFDEGGIRDCVQYADSSMRATMASALTSPIAIKELIKRLFRRCHTVASALDRSGHQLVAIVENAVTDVIPTSQSLVASLVAVLRAVSTPRAPAPIPVTADDRRSTFATRY